MYGHVDIDRNQGWSMFSGRSHDTREVTCWNSLYLKDCNMWKRCHTEDVHEELHLMRKVYVEVSRELFEGYHAGTGEE